MTSSYENLRWHETSPGTWRRGVDEIEQWYATMFRLYEGSRRAFFAITGHISLQVAVSDDTSPSEAEAWTDKALQAAWLNIRRDHPTIASQVSLDENTKAWTKTYHTIRSEEDQAAWLQQTLRLVTDARTGEEFANSDPPPPLLPTLFILHPPSRRQDGMVHRDLVFRSPHDIIDGTGTFLLFNNLVKHFSIAYEKGGSAPAPIFGGAEAGNLSPPFRVAVQAPAVLGRAQQARLKDELAGMNTAPGAGIVPIGVAYRPGATVPGIPQRVALAFTPAETKRLVAACREKGATVTHAFHAAIAIVLRDQQGREPASRYVRYVNYILRNERNKCIEPYNTAEHAVAPYHSIPLKRLNVDMVLRGSSDPPDAKPEDQRAEFSRILGVVRDFYVSVRDDPEYHLLAPAIWGALTPELPEAPSQGAAVPPPKALPSASISSMGLIDKIIEPERGRVSVYDPWVTGEELGNGLGLFLGTFRGEMCLSAAFNEAWHDRGEVLAFLRQCKQVVSQGLVV